MRALAYHQTQDAQAGEDAFAAYCAENRHIPYGVFAEQGKDEARPRFQEMIDRIQTSGVGYLVVIPSVEHLGGSIHEQVSRILELDSLHCEVICEDREAPDPLQAAVRAAKGEAAPDDRRMRIREGMRAKAAQGLGLGKPPYGYKVAFDGSLRMQPKEAAVVRAIFDMYLDENLGVRAVAARLNGQGLLTRTGRRWSMVTVRDILRNLAYMGTYRRFGLHLPHAYEPLVTSAAFRAVQEQMSSRRPVRKHPRSAPFLLAGLLYCGHCGLRMMGVVRRQAWKTKAGERRRAEYRYYQCQSRLNDNACAYRTVRAERVEGDVVAQLRERPALETAPPLAASGKGAVGQPRGINRRYLAFVERAAAGGMTLEQLRIAIGQADSARPEAQPPPVNGGSTEQPRAALAPDVWSALTPAERQGALRAVTTRVTLTDGVAAVTARGETIPAPAL